MQKGTSIDLNAIELFYRIANSGSLAEASRRLRLPKSTLSRQLAALELSLNSTLFSRKGRHLALTETGRLLYNHCERILGDVDAAVVQLSEHHANIRSRLHLSLPPDIGVNWLASSIIAYMVDNPGVDVYADVTNRWIDLLEEPYDLSIHIGGSTGGDVRPAQLIAQLKRGYFVSKNYSKRNGIPKHISDLHRHDCIVHEAQRREGLWSIILSPDSAETKDVKARVTVNNTSTVRELALSGGGVVILTEASAQSNRGALVQILHDWPIEPLSIYATYRWKQHLPQKIKSFLDILRKQLKTYPVGGG
ncbi:MAG: LysR family transcriptional regulator [Pseudorhodoplanes sp.]|uniref:LysR family transcriptional regulator n=1 Tax=Pseudorhodoplanes sp. TaxID=1934341 RepID=UPI003D0F3168